MRGEEGQWRDRQGHRDRDTERGSEGERKDRQGQREREREGEGERGKTGRDTETETQREEAKERGKTGRDTDNIPTPFNLTSLISLQPHIGAPSAYILFLHADRLHPFLP
jgi:hypothetical protein